jgi:2-dehydropantoate 2-reductase
MKFTVVGAGAIGGTIGAFMVREGEDVEFVDSASDHVAAMRAEGLSVEGAEGSFTVPVVAWSPEELRGPLEVVLLAVKAQHTESAVRSILPQIDDGTVLVSLQNGLCEPIIARLIGKERTIGGFINISADYLEPRRLFYGGPGAFYIGDLDGTITKRVEEIAVHLSHCVPVKVTSNVQGYLWSKLGYSNMLYATALVDEPMAEVIDQHRELMVELAAEIYQVAHAEGVVLESFEHLAPSLVYPRTKAPSTELKHALDAMLVDFRRNLKTKSGVWRDLAVRHRKTEVDYHSGLVLVIGDRHGLQLPLTRQVVRMIHEIEDGQRQMSPGNIGLLESIRARRRADQAVAEPSRRRKT